MMPNWVRVPLLSLVVLGLACDTADVVQRGRWQYTCGDPVCHGYQPTPGVAACTGQKSGDACPVLDERCDPQDPCNRLLFCSTDPPPPMPCPVTPQGSEVSSPPGEPRVGRRAGDCVDLDVVDAPALRDDRSLAGHEEQVVQDTAEGDR